MKHFLEKVYKKGPASRKREDRKDNRTRQKNKRGDSKVESNDSPEIPDRGETSDIPGLPLGGLSENKLGVFIRGHTGSVYQRVERMCLLEGIQGVFIRRYKGCVY